MGSGGSFPAMATRSSEPTVVVSDVCGVGAFVLRCVCERRVCVLVFVVWMTAVRVRVYCFEPIGRLGPVSYMPYGTSTSGLST